MDDQRENRRPSEVFRDNVQRLAIAQRLDLDGLASSLGFIRDDKKWLRRAWNDGLARPDKRAMPRLQKIAARLGLGDIDDLWNTQVVDDQSTVLRSVQMNGAAWERLVAQIMEYSEAVQIFRGMKPERAREIETKYEYDQVRMIADWVRRGADGESSDIIAKGDDAEVLDATKQVREFRADSDFRSRVMAALVAKDEWKQMIVELREKLGPEHADDEFARRLAACFSDPLTEAEVVARFFHRHLREFAEPDEDDPLIVFVNEVRDHPAWLSYVSAKFGNDEQAAIDSLADMWDDFEKQTGGAVPLEKAVHHFCSGILDPMLEEPYSDENVLAEGLSTDPRLN